MSKLGKLLSGAAVLGLLAGGPALAQQQGQQQFQQSGQQQGLNRNEIQQFFSQAENNLTQAVRNGNPQQIQQWTQQHIADEATFVGLMQAYGQRSNQPKGWIVMTGDKQELLDRRQAMFNAAPELLNALQDYDLQIQVQQVTPISENVSVVETRIRESGSIGGRGMQTSQQWGSGQQQQQFGQVQYGQQYGQTAGQGTGTGTGFGAQGQGQQGGQTLSFNSNANCEHVMHRGRQGNTILIGKTTCQGEMTHSY